MKRRDFLKGLAVGGAAVAAGACHGEVAPAGAVRFSQDVPVLGDYDVCVVGAVPYAGLRKRLDGRITFSPDEAA